MTDAIKQLIPAQQLSACIISGSRYDLGSKAGFIAANIEFAMQDPVLAQQISNKLAAAHPELAASILKQV